MRVLEVPDLANPVLSATQQAGLEYAAAHPPTLTVQAVEDRAATITKLPADFGDPGYRQRLQIWLDQVRLDDNRTPLAGMLLFNLCVKYAANRQRITQLLERHPEIHDQQITQPIFVTGLPRSGTTHLVNLLAADDRFRSLPLWEADQPVPDRGAGPGADGIDQRYHRCNGQWQLMQAANPFLAAWHPMNPDSIHEDIELWANDFAGYNIEWILQTAPMWRDHYVAADPRPHYEYLLTQLKILQWFRPRERWLLKCPQHLEQLPALMEVFPDATVIETQRDPVSVVQSAATMRAYSARTTHKTIDLDEILEYWTDLIARLLQRGMAGRSALTPERSLQVGFSDYMSDTMATVEQVYQVADFELTDTARRNIEAYIADHPRNRHGAIGYNLRKHFGVTPQQLRSRFDFYLDEFPLAIEVT